ncbi:MAG: hypothetical protein COW24_01440 [Candidatus Kerfeldbacteria bacterium CG15_BIG_FIL_POST_REV_8_21_14_020_45_12]|uniref:N-acetyltransferase domain-containing protein n=1 Tax=Candidatus Kerfeldbacteria bacterium CG15_BIG_FIL_POST_REV_8_21_14_020_45_12 TaxID=2014247 RepID=A0A2M7H4N1_9BACT|nr:MAG: hypothetical protein COW24_01440 [Candidatus Kerfeldbacteria bacterium CG15_BIG_FIL_POST_REV_8_21_14_020_45_12]PJA93014.1 MAG: hypothetical protein CO132_05080 [Candidatus Kerfeldbacteria bacterium CG_4_9_14_3_um_filter_45_8]
MNIRVDHNPSQADWQAFLLNRSTPPFLQAWEMQKLHASLGEQTLTLAFYDDDSGDMVGLALAIVVHARRGNYLFLPYGPVLTASAWKALPEITRHLKSIGKDNDLDFVRSSPFIIDSTQNRQLYHGAGWRPAPIHLLAENLWLLDISSPEEEVLKGMRKTMRNLIRRAERDGVRIEQTNTPEAVDIFIDIHQQTVERHKFTPYKDDYFRAQVEAFRESDVARVFIAWYQDIPISAAIMMYYGDIGSYHHGASRSDYNKIPASYLLQWEAIKEAKKRNCKTYNFWGVVPENKEKSRLLKRQHPWIGISRFKRGFGGSQFDILHCHDLPLSSTYPFTWTIETVRRLKRGQ